MNYDEAIEQSDLGDEIKERFFQSYIAPLLKDLKGTKHLPYFFHQGYMAWRLNVSKDDLKQLKFVEWLCEELKKVNEADFIEIMSSILAQQYEAGVRTEQAERNAYNSSTKKDKLMVFSDQIRLYKVFLENDFRLHATIPFVYVCKVYGKKNKVTNAADFVKVAASEKYQALKDTQVTLVQGDIQKLIVGFDNQIRNAGEGHDRWEVTDQNVLVLPVVSPETGSERGQIKLTEKELDELIKQCRKTLWILKMGYSIFLENNKAFEKKLKGKSVIRSREIEESVRNFADNRWFDIKKFDIKEDKSQISMTVKYRPRVIGTKTQVFFGTAEAYDLIKQETFVEYEYQMLDIIKMALLYFDAEKLPRIAVEMFDEKDISMGIVEYEPSELSKLLKEEGELEVPKPSKGIIPDKKCRLVVFIKVPYGMRDIYEKLLKERENNQGSNLK
jgi:hypothetical protein